MMRGVVYVDVLILVNAVIGIFLLRCTARMTGCRLPRWRAALGGAAAGVSSLVLLLPPLPEAVLWTAKAGSAAVVLLCAFGLPGRRLFCKVLFWYLALNFVLSGAVFAAVYYGGLGGVEVNNYTLYFNVSPLLLIACVAGVYLAVLLCETAFGRPQEHPKRPFSATLEMDGQAARINGTILLDTGFHVRDPLTGEDAFLLSFPSVKGSLPPALKAALDTYFHEGMLTPPIRLTSARTAAGVRALPALKASGLAVDGHDLGPRLAVFTPEILAEGSFEAVAGA